MKENYLQFLRLTLNFTLNLATTPTAEHILKANDEMHFTSRDFHLLNRTNLEKLLESTVIDDILLPIGQNPTVKGYFRAMKGLKEFNLAEIHGGCEEEISAKGQYWIECQIILAFTHTMCF